MVSTNLYEVATKYSDWAYGKRQDSSSVPHEQMSSAATTAVDNQPNPSASAYWNYANDKLKNAAEQAYSTAADMVSNALYADSSSMKMFGHTNRNWDPQSGSDVSSGRLPHLEVPKRSSYKRNTSISAKELAIMFNNPYEHVRGRQSHQSSFSVAAIRSLLTLVPQTMPQAQGMYTPITPTAIFDDGGGGECNALDDSWAPTPNDRGRRSISPSGVSTEETASQIAEGTIRALRDLALDEAVELHNALRFWSERWERPLLSWLEAGPEMWTRPGGYNHQTVGRKVSQLQAVLARRCASIGELQTHLLRAGWHKGVAQWGVLGGGWSAVAGFDGFSGETDIPGRLRTRTRTLSSNEIPPTIRQATKYDDDYYIQDPSRRPPIETMLSSQSEANIFVEKFAGGGLVVDDPAFLCEWSVEGIRLVRRQLEQSANAATVLPHQANWTSQPEVGPAVDGANSAALPSWAKDSTMPLDDLDGLVVPEREISAIDLNAMIEEVADLVDVMEPIIQIQRRRRLDKLCPPPWIRRNWFIVTAAGPIVSYALFQAFQNDYAKEACKELIQKVKGFCRERIQEPVSAIIQELWKGRAPFSDREARLEAIESLKKMIRNWLGM